MNIELISKHRSALMGFALIWVMLYHLCGQGDCQTLQKSILAIGHAGVDIFFFLSGLGLTYSYYERLKSLADIKQFYWKRFYRIIPTYYLVILISSLVLHKTIIDTLWRLSCIGFWISKPYYDWYIPSLLLFYICFPIFIYLSHKYNIYKTAVLFIIVGLIGTIGLILIGRGTIILFISRIPILFVGCISGYYLKYVKQTIRKPVAWGGIMLSVIGICSEIVLTCHFDATFLRRTALHHLPFVLIVPGLCLSLSYFFEWISKIGCVNWFVMALTFIGTYSLEIYLAHMSLRGSPWFIYIILAIGSGFLLSRIVNDKMNFNGKQ